jgi:hypothetical protein
VGSPLSNAAASSVSLIGRGKCNRSRVRIEQGWLREKLGQGGLKSELLSSTSARRRLCDATGSLD